MNRAGYWALALAGMFVAYVAVKSISDVVRYIKISRM
jgi:hypothetical protein